MPWVTERLIGTIDGNNKNFTISHEARSDMLFIFFEGIPLEAVGSQPETMQAAYVQAGMNINLGLAPQVGQNPWSVYFYEP